MNTSNSALRNGFEEGAVLDETGIVFEDESTD